MTARRTSAPGPLSASRRGGTVALVAVLACCVAGPARAQDSQFGIKGLGTPGRMEGVRGRRTSDLRVAASARAWGRLWLGLGLHLLTGSTRLRAVREFTNTTYSTAAQTEDVNYDGAGISASAIGLLGPTLRVAAFARSDSRLRARLAGAEIARNDLPVTVGGAVGWQPGSATRVAATGVEQSWGDAGQYAHNTTNWAVGAELGNQVPLRLGARGGALPFRPR